MDGEKGGGDGEEDKGVEDENGEFLGIEEEGEDGVEG